MVGVGAGYGGSDVEVDLRSDDDPDPLPDLARLLDLHQLYFGTTAAERLRPVTDELAAETAHPLEGSGYTPADGSPSAIVESLSRWAGAENLEKRLGGLAEGLGAIDSLVLGMLRAKRHKL